ncbi:hypothetical protein P872_09070 [Rhodonellum psychrophilum GCM71 = DSM 17998]|uniref:Polysaccharide chain length determinant N-terminal domain-containing protein n=2 Tax=Rhodonellum TaxID=336827 RepID=U5BL69_9BACT|nr:MULTISPECIES: Wzz/FepE/Etk N-terminal domain-containing protein [Rhodonellum]ERM81235.1 hypothetical protein P872_09070 [Rhodonellum psychrophilum GCM71 = DSM 17998]SDZ32629.1 Uncharacterized protein involved in exopolysaccharide biosynthesis [Rhodonellum ikkaensis]
MNLIRIIKLLVRKKFIIVFFPLTVALLAFLLNRNNPKEYQSGMIFNTGIASGTNLSSMSNSRVDYFAVNNAFDNLTTILQSRETLEDVAISLLALHLSLDSPDPYIISKENFNKLREEHLSPAVVAELTKTKEIKTIEEKIRIDYYNQEPNDLKVLLQKSKTFYNIDAIKANMTFSRKGNSDMLEIIYRSNDPGVCLSTLSLLADIFKVKYSSTRNFEAGGIIEYFIAELEKAKMRLNNAEETLKNYSQENQIINYEEQTKFISEGKEELEKDIYKVKMELESSTKALAEISVSMDETAAKYLNGEGIMRQMKEIAQLTTAITTISLRESSPKNIKTLDSLQQVQDNMRAGMINTADEYYSRSYSKEILPRLTVLSEYLKYVLEIDKNKAKLEVLLTQRLYFIDLFSEFAPVGFNLSKMAREIQIAEQEYLSILHGLNQAKIHKSNSELFGNLSLLDRPFYPLNPKGSKMAMVLIAGFMVSLLFVVGTIVGLEIMDRKIKTPSSIQEATNLKLLGVISSPIQNKKILQEDLQQKLLNLLSNNLNIALNKSNTEAKNLIFLTSTRTQDNMNEAGLFVSKALQKLTDKVIYYYFTESNDTPELTENEESKIFARKYDPIGNQVIQELRQNLKEQDGVIVRIPEFENAVLNTFSSIVPSIVILMVNADQAWGFHDKAALDFIKETFPKSEIYTVGTDMNVNYMEEVISEVPKNRGKLRVWVKGLITLNK